jgi:hypothetical protein
LNRKALWNCARKVRPTSHFRCETPFPLAIAKLPDLLI